MKRILVGCFLTLLVGTAADAVELELPIDPADFGFQAYGVAPFGYHIAEHRYDGHPGLDFEYKPGAKIRAAHGGSFRYTADGRDATLKTVTIEWQENGVNYQTFYTNVSALEAGLTNGSTVTTGQVFGTAGSVTGYVGGSSPVTYAMTHFQFNDNRVTYGLTNAGALSPETYFSATAKASLATAWQKMQYAQMVCEPFLSTSRGMTPYPVVTRRWQRRSGSLAETIEFTCDFSLTSNAYRYRLLNAAGVATESGTASLTAVVGGTSSIDLTNSSGGMRRGVLTVKDDLMQLDYAAVGATRPANLSAATSYSTTVASVCAKSTDAVCFSGNTSPYRSGDKLTLGITVDLSKTTSAGTGGDLWLGVVPPGGSLLYLHPDGQLRSEAKAWKTAAQVTADNPVFEGLTLPAGIAKGGYAIYAALNPAGKALTPEALLSNIAETQIHIAP